MTLPLYKTKIIEILQGDNFKNHASKYKAQVASNSTLTETVKAILNCRICKNNAKLTARVINLLPSIENDIVEKFKEILSKQKSTKRSYLIEDSLAAGNSSVLELLLNQIKHDENYIKWCDIVIINKDLPSLKILISHITRVHSLSERQCIAKGLLPLASKVGDVPIFMLLFENSGARVNKDDLLHTACEYGSTEIALFLIEKGANLSKQNTNGLNSLELAAFYWQKDLLKTLIQKFDKDLTICKTRSSTGDTLLHHACQRILPQPTNTEILDYLVDTLKFSFHAKNKNGSTPIDLVFFKEHCTIFIDYILENNLITIEAAYEKACFHQNLAIIKLLIEKHNCNPTVAIKKMLQKKEIAICQKLIHTYGITQSQLFQSLDKKGIEKLIDNNIIALNEMDKDGNTALHIACFQNRAALAELLIKKYKLEITKPNRTNETPLFISCKINSVPLVNLFRSHGIVDKLYVLTYCNRIVLSQFALVQDDLLLAAKMGNLDAVKYMIEVLEVDPKTKNASASCLSVACGSENSELILYLINTHHLDLFEDNSFAFYRLCQSKNKAFLRDILKKLPLTYKALPIACMAGNLFVVKVLIEEIGFTPDALSLEAAATGGCKDIVVYLLNERQIRPPPNRAKSLMRLALEKGHYLLATFLLKKKYYRREDLSLNLPLKPGYQDIVLALLEKGALPNHKNEEGKYPLEIACEEGLFHLALKLLENGADPNLKKDTFPLHAACQKTNAAVALKLIEKGAYTHVVDKSGNTALDLCCQSGADLIIETLLENKAPHKKNLLTLACQKGLLSTVQLLVKKGFTLKDTHLFSACSSGNADLVRYLNPKESIKDAKGNTLQHYAYRAKSREVTHYLDKKFNPKLRQQKTQLGNTPLHIACIEGNLDAVKEHFTHPSHERDHQLTNIEGKTPLFLAAKGGCIEIVKYFLDEIKITAPYLLHTACAGGFIPLVTYLIEEKKLSLLKKNATGLLPINLAAQNGHFDLVKFLIEEKKSPEEGVLNSAAKGGYLTMVKTLSRKASGIDLLKASYAACLAGKKEIFKFFHLEKQVPLTNQHLHAAVKSGYTKMARHILKRLHSASLFYTDIEGNTAFHHACKLKEPLEMIKLLLNYKFPLNTQNKEGETPLILVAKSKRSRVLEEAEILLKAGADPNICNWSKKSALFFAYDNKNIPLCLALLEAKAFPDLDFRQISSQELKKAFFNASIPYKMPSKAYSNFAEIIPSHFEKIKEIKIDYEKVPNIDFIEEFKKLFPQINFENPNEPGYVDPQKVDDQGILLKLRCTNPKKKLQEKIIEFAKNVQNRGRGPDGKNCMSEVPPLKENGEETIERKAFFDLLQVLVAEDIKKMKVWKGDRMIRNEHLIQLAIAAFHCGARYKQAAEDAYLELVKEKRQTFEERIYKLFTDMRVRIVKNLATPPGRSMNTHNLNTFLYFLKTERGLPNLSFAGDPAAANITKELALQKFDSFYTPLSITNELFDAFYGPATTFSQDEVIEWFETYLPNEWERDQAGYISQKSLLKLLAHFEILDISFLKAQGYFNPDQKQTDGKKLLDVLDDEDEALFLINRGADLSVMDPTKRAALQIAAEEGSAKVVKALIENGAKIDAKDQKGFSALHEAVDRGDLEIVTLLLNAHADANIKTKEKKTPFHLAKTKEIADLLIAHGAKEVQDNEGRAPRLKRALDQADKTGQTPLHDAAISNLSKELDELITKGANLHAKDENGVTPLLAACRRGHLQSVQKLREKDASTLQAITKTGNTALHLACYSRNLELLIYLLDQGLNFNAVNNNGFSVLYQALLQNNVTFAKELLKRGVTRDLTTVIYAKDQNLYDELFQVTGRKRPSSEREEGDLA